MIVVGAARTVPDLNDKRRRRRQSLMLNTPPNVTSWEPSVATAQSTPLPSLLTVNILFH